MSSDTNPPPLPTSNSPEGATSTRHPAGFWFFFWGEFAERYSYYGMRVLLPLYMTARLEFKDNNASTIMFAFKMAVYFLPLVGGFIADRFLGKYWTIVSFSIPYVLGHFILGIEEPWALFLGLVLLAGGSGVIKPNVSTLMGLTYDQKRPGNERLRAASFMWFYFSVNIGAFLSQVISPLVRGTKENPKYGLAFGIAAWMMVGALGIFALGKPFYAVEKRQQRRQSFGEVVAQLKQLLPLFLIFFFIILFWLVYEQNDVQWVLFVRTHVNLPVFDIPAINLGLFSIAEHKNFELQADYFQFLNPLLVVIFVPTFNILFKTLDPKVRIFTSMRKMFVGFGLETLAVALMASAAQMAATSNSKVSIGWYLCAYTALTIGEILIYGTGLEMAYAYAPQGMKSFVSACFLVTSALANLANMVLSRFYSNSLHIDIAQEKMLPPQIFFGAMTVLMIVTTIAFFFAGRRFDRHARPTAAT